MLENQLRSIVGASIIPELICKHSRIKESMIRTVASVLYLFLNISFGICAPIPTITDPALLVISYDAFRPEYLHRKVTPNLNKLAKEGTSAPYMLNVFPTKTFVNHFTIATVSKQ